MELIASSNTTARLAHGGLSDCAEAQAINILREQLLSGVLEPGARLTEIELSSELQIARATVRQALHHLAQEGLIVLIPYTGWMVIDLTSVDAWEIYTLRAAIEALAAKLAATNLSDLGRQELQDIMASGQGRRVGFAARRRQGGFRLAQGDRHRRLAEQYRIVSQQVRIFITSSDALVAGAALVDQHQPIVDAILAGDGARRSAVGTT